MINISKIKQTNLLIEKIKKSSNKDLLNYLQEDKHKSIVLDSILNSLFPKETIDKLFEESTFEKLIEGVNIIPLLNSINFYKLISHYNVQAAFTAKIFNYNIFDIIDNINNEDCLFRFLNLYFVDNRCSINDEYKKNKLQELDAYKELNAYIKGIKLRIIKLTDEQYLSIINKRYNKNYRSLDEIFNSQNVNPAIFNFAINAPGAPAFTDKAIIFCRNDTTKS